MLEEAVMIIAAECYSARIKRDIKSDDLFLSVLKSKVWLILDC